MFQNMSKKKISIIFLLFFLILSILYYVFVIKGFTFREPKIAVPESFPADSEGPWQIYVWHGEQFAFPNNWKLEENSAGDGSDASAQVISFRFVPKVQDKNEDYVGVGGGTCDTIKATICLGHEPVYTNSKNSDVLITYNTILKHISKVEKK